MASIYLTKRNGKYHFRIRVPEDLKGIVGSREIHRALRTSDIRMAKRLAGDLRAKIQTEFAQLRYQRLLAFEIVLPLNGNGMRNALPRQNHSHNAVTDQGWSSPIELVHRYS